MKLIFYFLLHWKMAQMYSELCQTSQIEQFVKIVNG